MRPLFVALSTFILVVISSSAIAQVPDSLSFQGVLTDTLGSPLDSLNVSMTFKLYKGSTAIWSETQLVDVVDGVYNVYLGAVTPLDTVSFNRSIDLGVHLDGDASEMSPRIRLTSAAYARALPWLYTRWPATGLNAYSPIVVGGATNNVASTQAAGSTISGGGGFYAGNAQPNAVVGLFTTVGGGMGNTAGGYWGTVGGGADNEATGNGAAVAGGQDNSATGHWSTVPGGTVNWAKGSYSFAAGSYARALHDGSFVWQDETAKSMDDTLATWKKNMFRARASGGFYFQTAAAPDLGTGASLGSGSGSWSALSSRASKTDLKVIDPADYLERVASLEVNEWSYKTEHGVTHVGPMAEDFYEAFGHGPNESSITTVDADGVALAAIQGLYELVQEQQSIIESLQAEVKTLSSRANR